MVEKPKDVTHKREGKEWTMGKYLPIIVTADCGSLTQAGKILGYAQPNMGSIVTRVEKELGVQLFYRSRHGVTLTETGEKLVAIMRQIDDMEDYLQAVVTRTRKERFRVGVFQSVAIQWMPQVVKGFCGKYPDTVVQMEYLDQGRRNPSGFRENRLDCAFFRGTNFPEGMDHVPLLTDTFCLLVPAYSPLAAVSSVSLAEVAGKYPYIHANGGMGWEGEGELRRKLMAQDIVKVSAPEDRAVIDLVAQGLGMSILPRLSLWGVTPADRVKAIPLEDAPTCPISLLLPKKGERSPLTAVFLRLLQNRVREWEAEQIHTKSV
jgi:DNA-binding transcriptional LysR family regulator